VIILNFFCCCVWLFVGTKGEACFVYVFLVSLIPCSIHFLLVNQKQKTKTANQSISFQILAVRNLENHWKFLLVSKCIFWLLLRYPCWHLLFGQSFNFFSYNIPWFIFIVDFFCVTLSFHFYFFIRNREYLQLHISLVIILNFFCFCVWLFVGTKGEAWFVYVFLVSLIPCSIHLLLVKQKQNKDRNLYIHVTIFVILNAIIFMVYLQHPSPIPYFIFCFSALMFPLSVHWFVRYHFESTFTLHLYFYLNIQTLVFLLWIFTGMIWPWFELVLIPGTILIGIHWYILSKRQPPPSPEPIVIKTNTHDDLENDVLTPQIQIDEGTENTTKN